MDYIFTTQSLKKEYGKYKALDGLTMHVPRGSVYGFVGKNGAGKTTLIRLLCGLQNPTGGDIVFNGIKNTDSNFYKERQKIGAMVEAPAIYKDMTAEENMKQQYRILGKSSYDSIRELLKLVGLEETGHKKARNFSQGMRQKLGIAMALSGNPEFLILDEPVNGLDPQGIIELRELILKLNRERGVTVLISSHILGELSKLATHYGFIDHGHMMKEMTAEELEQACRKSVCMEISNREGLKSVFDRMKLDYEFVSDTQVKMVQTMTISQLAFALRNENCEIISCREEDENLEDYFINLVGGEPDV